MNLEIHGMMLCAAASRNQNPQFAARQRGAKFWLWDPKAYEAARYRAYEALLTMKFLDS